jgi:cytochrome bd-type quinol oxidase subunit 2
MLVLLVLTLLGTFPDGKSQLFVLYYVRSLYALFSLWDFVAAELFFRVRVQSTRLRGGWESRS